MANYMIRKYAEAVKNKEMVLNTNDNPNNLPIVPIRYCELVKEYMSSMVD